MPKLSSAIRILRETVASAISMPRATIDALKLLPSTARGLQYSRSDGFSAPSNQKEAAEPGVNPLLDYFLAHKTGPGLWKWMHYFDIYHRHFSKFIGREIHVLEVGIYSGGSLGMWREYFGENCRIYGVDIEPACLSYKAEGIDVFIGDQSDRNFWKRFKESVPKVDILIDDGGHAPEQQRITLEEMLPHIQPGGVYLCEDIVSMPNNFAGYISGLLCNMNASRREEEIFDAPFIPSAFQAAVQSIHQYPYVTVIEKHDRNPGLFVSKKHGTEWQPY